MHCRFDKFEITNGLDCQGGSCGGGVAVFGVSSVTYLISDGYNDNFALTRAWHFSCIRRGEPPEVVRMVFCHPRSGAHKNTFANEFRKEHIPWQ